MQMTKNKNAVTRIAAAILAAITLTIAFAFSTVSVKALAADEPVITEEITAEENTEDTIAADTADTYEADFNAAFAVDGFNAEPVAYGGESFEVVALSGSTEADTAYNSVITFFITWIRRIGAMVAFIGAIMFGLAIKNNDAEQKQAALITMVAGFVVWAVCLAVNMFNLFG